MALPPGRDAVSVPGFDETVNPKLTRAAGEVAAWIDYLLHPQDNDGPRVYRMRHGEGENPFPRRNEELDSRTDEYETVSIWEDFAADPDAFLRPVQAIAGMRHELISDTYDKLLKGYFTWSRITKGAGPDAIDDDKVVRYFEVNSARMDWMQMRTGWKGEDANTAFLYEEAFIWFQVITENCLYIVAEHLARYWAIFDKAGRDLLELMDALTKECAGYDPLNAGSGLTLDVMSIVVSAVIAATVTVITGGVGATVGKVLHSAASTALSKPSTKPHRRRRSTSRWTSTTISGTPPNNTSTASRRSNARSPRPSPSCVTIFAGNWTTYADAAGTKLVVTAECSRSRSRTSPISKKFSEGFHRVS